MDENKNINGSPPVHAGRKRLLAVILLLAVCAVTVFAVGRGLADAPPEITDAVTDKDNPPETHESADVPVETSPVKPGSVADYGGATFKVLVTEKERKTGFDGGDAPTLISNVDSEYAKLLEFDLNIELKTVYLQSPASYVQSAWAANEGDTADLLVLDLFVDTSNGAAPDTTHLLINGMLADLCAIDTVKLGGEGYYPDVNTALSVCGSTYLAASSATVGFRDSLIGVIYDKGLISASDTDVHKLVKDGKWTFDTLGTLAKDIGSDVNTDCDEAVVWMMGTGARDAFPTADGFTVDLTSNNSVDTFMKMKNVLYGNVSADGKVGGSGSAFRQGTVDKFAKLDKDSYGLLPLPKANVDGIYRSVSKTENATVMAVTSFCFDKRRSGTVMNVLAERSHLTYGNEYLADVCGTDEKSCESLEYIIANRSVCLIAVLGYPDTLEDACETLIMEKNNDPTAFLKQRSYFLQYVLDTIVDDIMKATEKYRPSEDEEV